jgi:hypothetical protein
MSPYRLLLLSLALALAGCHARGEQRAMLDAYQAELRRYESIIYQLEYDNEILQSENDRLKARSTPTTPPPEPPLSVPFPGRTPRTPSLGPDRPPPDVTPDDEDLMPPMIDPGPPAPSPPPGASRVSPPALQKPEVPSILPEYSPADDDSPDEPPPLPPARNGAGTGRPTPRPTSTAPSILVPSAPSTSPGAVEALPAPQQPKRRLPELLPEPEDKKVSSLFIDPQQTRSVDLDRASGDDAIRLVLEPRNEAGQFIPTAGKVSVVVLDPSRQGAEARLGRWDFEPDVVRHQLHQSGRNIPLELPWTGAKPASERLAVFVRWETPEGEKVDARHDVAVSTRGASGTQQVSNRWTPRPRERSGPLSAQHEPTRSEVIQAEAVESAALPEWSPKR